jgi:hypothetical protein
VFARGGCVGLRDESMSPSDDFPRSRCSTWHCGRCYWRGDYALLRRGVGAYAEAGGGVLGVGGGVTVLIPTADRVWGMARRKASSRKRKHLL